MIKKLTSLALASALLICPAGKLSHADSNEELARKIAAIFEESEKKSQQKLNLETCKSQQLEEENKELLQEIEKLKNNKEKSNSPSFWSETKAMFKGISSAFLALTAVASIAVGGIAGLAGVWTLGSAAYDCHFDEKCTSFREKLNVTTFKNSFSAIKDFVIKFLECVKVVLISNNNNNNNNKSKSKTKWTA